MKTTSKEELVKGVYSNREKVNCSDGIFRKRSVYNNSDVPFYYALEKDYKIDNHFFASNLPDKMQEKYFLFQKEVSKERYTEVIERFKILSEYPFHSFRKWVYMLYGSFSVGKIPIPKERIWEDWNGIGTKAIDYLVSLPEFDRDIFFDVTGIKIN